MSARVVFSPREGYPFKYGSKFFQTEWERDAYRERSNTVRAAKRAGFDTTREGLKAYKRARDLQEEAIQEKKRRLAWERQERDRIREENGMHPNARTSFVLANEAAREDFRKFMSKSNQAGTTDKQRVEFIRELYRQRNITPEDMLYRIGRIVGVIT